MPAHRLRAAEVLGLVMGAAPLGVVPVPSAAAQALRPRPIACLLVVEGVASRKTSLRFSGARANDGATTPKRSPSSNMAFA